MLLSVVLVSGCASDHLSDVSQESAPSGVTPTLLSRGTLAVPFKVETEGAVPIEIKTKAPIDIITRQHDYAVGGHTGWHTHPGPVFITVTAGSLTFYEATDPTCAPHVYTVGQTYVDTGLFVKKGGRTRPGEESLPKQDEERPCPIRSLS